MGLYRAEERNCIVLNQIKRLNYKNYTKILIYNNDNQ
jgi:hypothetical protein